MGPALEAIRWLDEQGDLDGDGFYEYRTCSEQGLRNQAWKDSEDAIVYPDGTLVEPPIATCEEQAFVYAAKFLLAEVLWWLGDKGLGRRFWHQAQELKKRFHEAFWMDDEGFYAMGLDARKRPIRSIGSNAGHCLPTGIVEFAVAPRLAKRLLGDDLFSGWGIRTLSSLHPAYNPHSYHRGTVWPVEQGTFCLGFWRYGLHDHLDRLARSQVEAARLFAFNRLPELFGGHARDLDHPFPAMYRRANSPQAWSSSSLICTIQALLGLYPYAPLGVLIVDPHLPEWLPEITLRHLRVGSAAVSLRFFRRPDGRSDFDILSLEGRLKVLRQPSPWSLSSTWPERIGDVFSSRVRAAF